MTRKADKDATTQVILNLIKEAEELKKQEDNLKTLAKNTFQPVPELIEVDATVNEEKTNKEVAPNQIMIKFTGSPQLAACGASYIKYYLTYEDGKTLSNHFACDANEKTFMHTFDSANLASMLHELKEKEINFTIKKKKFFGATALETTSFNLSSFGAHSVFEKIITMQAARVSV